MGRKFPLRQFPLSSFMSPSLPKGGDQAAVNWGFSYLRPLIFNFLCSPLPSPFPFFPSLHSWLSLPFLQASSCKEGPRMWTICQDKIDFEAFFEAENPARAAAPDIAFSELLLLSPSSSESVVLSTMLMEPILINELILVSPERLKHQLSLRPVGVPFWQHAKRMRRAKAEKRREGRKGSWEEGETARGIQQTEMSEFIARS